jgi:membrane associated rhomboid family serine protease
MSMSFRRDREPILMLPVVVTASVGVMVAIHILRLALPETVDDLVVGLFAFAPDRYLGGGGGDGDPAWPGGVAAAIWSPFTYALLHNDLIHLGTNCAVFAALGKVLARRLTATQFLLFCVVMAPISALGELLIAPWQPGPVIGVSGVICAMMGAFARFAYPAEPDVEQEDWDPDARQASDDARVTARRAPARAGRLEIAPVGETLRRVKVLQFIGAFALMNLLLAVAAPMLVGGGAGVAWMVHVVGFVAGFLTYPWFERAPVGAVSG